MPQAKFNNLAWVFVVCAVILSLHQSIAVASERIVSNNLCADQYVLALAEPRRILALSPLAADASVSFNASRATSYPRVQDDVETVLALKPDLVLSSVYGRSAITETLTKHGVLWSAIQEPENLHDIPAELRRIGEVLGASAAAERLARDLEAELTQTAGLFAQSELTALIYDRGGYTQKSGGIPGAILKHLGIANAAATHSRSAFSAISLEEAIALNPTFLVIQDAPYFSDQGAILNAHPALARQFPEASQIKVPVSLAVCTGPSVIAALQTITQQVREKLEAAP